MKRIKWFPIAKCILVLIAVLMVAGFTACAKSTTTKTSPATTTTTSTTTPSSTYQLTHSSADAEYILNWDFVISQYPEIGAYDKQEAFVHRGESKKLSTGETFSITLDSPVAWSSVRLAKPEAAGENFRSFGVFIMYCETNEGLDEYLQMDNIKNGMLQGVPMQKEGDFTTAVVETETPLQTVILLLAGRHFAIMLMEYATPDQLLFLGKEVLMELLSTVRGNITALEITPLPSDIPGRIS